MAEAISALYYQPLDYSAIAKHVRIDHSDSIFRQLRHHIKPLFPQQKLSYSNLNGKAAQQFNREIVHYKKTWIYFELKDYASPPNPITDWASNAEQEQYSPAQIREWIAEVSAQIQLQQLFVMLSLSHLHQPSRGRFIYKLPSEAWPCDFEIHEILLTNATKFLTHHPKNFAWLF